MQERVADLWSFPADLRVVTTNGVVGTSGNLIMGAGVAKKAMQVHPWLPATLGAWVKEHGNVPFIDVEAGIITLPTKHHWKDDSDINLIVSSVERVVVLVNALPFPEERRVAMTRPGCGNGRLQWSDVKDAIKHLLDDRFFVLTDR